LDRQMGSPIKWNCPSGYCRDEKRSEGNAAERESLQFMPHHAFFC
jgi:hypothetical protein